LNNTYQPRTNYRKIYEQHYGPIPVDPDGRTYDIHHIDGNHSNNKISNLKLVTIQEHFDIHYAQGDFSACQFIASRLNLTPDEIKNIAKLNNLKRIKNGTHNFLGSKNPSHARVKNGTHNLLDSELAKQRNRNRIVDGTHNFLGGKLQSATAKKQLELGRHPSQIKYTCAYCGITCGAGQFKQWHNDKCKLKSKVTV
jgi:hypothetical protein